MTLVSFVVVVATLSVVITWMYNKSGQSLPMIILLHANYNNFSGYGMPAFFPGLQTGSSLPVITLGVLALAIIAFTRGRLGYHRQLAAQSPAADSTAPTSN